MMLKKLLRKTKIFAKLKNIFSVLEQKTEFFTFSRVQSNLKTRMLNKEKISVLFICNRPAVWGSLKTVYEEMKKDFSFDVKIVAIPNKKQLPDLGWSHEIYESEGAESFWLDDDCIVGYDYEKKEWIDIKKLKPSYVFIQQPYNICKPKYLKSSEIFKYAKLCYVSYFTFLSNKINDDVNDECNPKDFLRNLSFYFTQCKDDTLYIKKRLFDIGNDNCKVIMTGYPCYDNLDYSNAKSKNWRYPEENRFRIMWTPRWCTNEGNCNFFEYKDELVKYCKDEEDVEFIFRPHPQAFLNWISTGEMSEEDVVSYKNVYEKSNNMKIDKERSYTETFATSSCLVTDISSIIPEYFLTGKPIIYCNKKDSKNTFIKNKGFIKGFYWVESWDELKNVLDMLKSGQDPLREKRMELIKSEFYICEEKAGYLIKEEIKKDYYNA